MLTGMRSFWVRRERELHGYHWLDLESSLCPLTLRYGERSLASQGLNFLILPKEEIRKTYFAKVRERLNNRAHPYLILVNNNRTLLNEA